MSSAVDGGAAHKPATHVAAHPRALPERRDRLLLVLALVADLPPACTGLEAYRQLATTMNDEEDGWFGSDTWAPPRTFLDGRRTERLYPILPESFHPVAGWPGVTLLLARREAIFVSRHGAIEVQDKREDDPFGERFPFPERTDRVLFAKSDATGHPVWHPKDRS